MKAFTTNTMLIYAIDSNRTYNSNDHTKLINQTSEVLITIKGWIWMIDEYKTTMKKFIGMGLVVLLTGGREVFKVHSHSYRLTCKLTDCIGLSSYLKIKS